MPHTEAIVLLPELPSSADVRGRPRFEEKWARALSSWGVTSGGPATAGANGLLVVARARDAVASGAEVVLVDGRDRARRLTRAGYQVRTYVARRSGQGSVMLTPVQRVRLGRAVRSRACKRERGDVFCVRPGRRTTLLARHARTPRQVLIAGVRAATGRHYLTVAHRDVATPALVRSAVEAGAGGHVTLIAGGGLRRRSTLLVSPENDARPHIAVKVAPASWADRGLKEQDVLRRLHTTGVETHAPRPLGSGLLGPFAWSAETAASGRPLAEVVASTRHSTNIQSVLEDLASWFTELGAATRTVRTWSGEDGLALRGEHRGLSAVRAALSDVPGVLVHGDVGTGLNVLVDRRSFNVIDWETAAVAELPLTDLLPLACQALALSTGHRSPEDAGHYILELCAGKTPESRWLLSVVDRYCRELQIPPEQVGALASLAWGYQASMRLVHDELIVQEGGVAVPWTTAADSVARNWITYEGLGLSWPALTEGRF